MDLTMQRSRHFDAACVVDPARRGDVAWSQLNEHFAGLIGRDWRQVNAGVAAPLPWTRRALRLVLAWGIHRRHAFLDLERKAAALWRAASTCSRR